jgi:CreA protein
MRYIRLLALILISFMVTNIAMADGSTVGSVDTTYNLLTPNDSIKVVVLDDPDIPNVHCYMSTAVTGGLSGALGVASDKSEYDLSCFSNGAVNVPASLPQQAQIAMEHRSAFFKKLRIVRMIDRENHRLIYLAYTTWFVDGSPKHAMSSVGY